MGEAIAAEYLKRRKHTLVDTNFVRKTGEIDVITLENDTLHFVEVKSVLVDEFPVVQGIDDAYDPSVNIHEAKVKKVARTAEWFVAEQEWEGEWQVDGCLVWLRRRDGMARVSFLEQIV